MLPMIVRVGTGVLSVGLPMLPRMMKDKVWASTR